MHAVTAVSGSGPAYVFHLIEALAAAGARAGLPEALAMELARGHGRRAPASWRGSRPRPLRSCGPNVTSPGGTTPAALAVLMAPGRDRAGAGSGPWQRRPQRSRELA